MTDRELLELAAKAAGMRVGFEPDGKERGRYDLYWSHVHHQLIWHGRSAGAEYPKPIFWNPLTDDGDALRLAVTLIMSVDIGPHAVVINWAAPPAIDCRERVWVRVEVPVYSIGIEAATRRAIVRAAAEIGENIA